MQRPKDGLYSVKPNGSNKILIMQTIRQYIQNYKQLAFSHHSHTPNSSQKRRNSSHKQSAHSKHHQSIEQQNTSCHHSKLYTRKISLPPIRQRSNKSVSIDLKGSCVINRFLHNKSIVAAKSHRRSKTLQQKLTSNLINCSTVLPHAQEMRMRPMVKYSYHLENMRLAEKLLVVKPSPDVNRSEQKKFFMQQRHYRDQISFAKGYHSIKSSRYTKRSQKKQQL